MDKIFINAAMNLLDNWPAQRCFAHTLQFSIRAVLKMKAIAKSTVLQRPTAHFKCSNVAVQALREKQKVLQYYDITAVLEVIIDCSTRWISTLDML